MSLYTESNVQHLSLSQLLINKDNDTGKLNLNVRILQSPDSPWTNLLTATSSFNVSTKEVTLEFTPSNDDARFYCLYIENL